MKYYAVKVGRNPGIYNSWEECHREVDKFPNASYKSFKNYDDAKEFLSPNPFEPLKEDKEVKGDEIDSISMDTAIAYVDGSFRESERVYGYGLVFISNGCEEYFNEKGNKEEYLSMRNVSGEIWGAMVAIKKAIERGFKKIIIYYDYLGIEKWARGEWKTNKEGTRLYKKFIDKVSNGIEIEFRKVLAHSGNKYNELADSLAKKAVGI